MRLEECLGKVRNATVFEFGNIPRIFRIRTFPSAPQPVNAPDECPGPFIPSPLVPSVISTPGRWHIIAQLEIPRSVHGCGDVYVGPRTVSSINFQSRICLPMPLTLSIANKLGITPQRSRPGLMVACSGPRHLHPTSLALPRWLHSESLSTLPLPLPLPAI